MAQSQTSNAYMMAKIMRRYRVGSWSYTRKIHFRWPYGKGGPIITLAQLTFYVTFFNKNTDYCCNKVEVRSRLENKTKAKTMNTDKLNYIQETYWLPLIIL